MLCVTALRQLDECYLLSTVEGQGFEETIVDRAMGWIEAQCEEHPALQAERGALLKEAAEIVEAWQTRHMAVIMATKNAVARTSTSVRWFLDKKRLQALIVETCFRTHETFSAFLAPPTHPVCRWQRWLVIVTLILGVFTVDIWLYWNRATLCCAEVRAYLECNPLPSEPCRGFTGDCADLPLQFRDIPGSGLETYECTQFPDPANGIHRVIAGLLMLAVSLPTKRIIERLFELSNDPCGYEDFWLQNIGYSKMIAGHISWWYSEPGKKVRAWQRLWARGASSDRDPDLLVIELAARPLRLLWSVVTRKKRLEDAMKADWDAADDEGRAAELLAEHRRRMRGDRKHHHHHHHRSGARTSVAATSGARMSTVGGLAAGGGAVGWQRAHSRVSSSAATLTTRSARGSLYGGGGGWSPEAAAGGGGAAVSGRVLVRSSTGRRSVAGGSSASTSSHLHQMRSATAALQEHSVPDGRHAGGRASVVRRSPAARAAAAAEEAEEEQQMRRAKSAAVLLPRVALWDEEADDRPPAATAAAASTNVATEEEMATRRRSSALPKGFVLWPSDAEGNAEAAGDRSNPGAVARFASGDEDRGDGGGGGGGESQDRAWRAAAVAAGAAATANTSNSRPRLFGVEGGRRKSFSFTEGTGDDVRLPHRSSKSGATRLGPPAAAHSSRRRRVSVAAAGGGVSGPHGRASSSRSAFAVSSRHRISVAVAGSTSGTPLSSQHLPRLSHRSSSAAAGLLAAGAATPGQQRLLVPEIDAVYDATVADARALRRKRWTAIVFIYITWLLLAWFTFTYGSLVYQLLGDKAESAFVKDWAIGLGMDNASQWKDVFKTAIQTAIVMIILDRLGFIGGEPWLEVHVDTLSIHATMFSGKAMSWLQSLKAYRSYIQRIESAD